MEQKESQTQEHQQSREIQKKKIIENCTPFTDWTSELNNTQIDSAKDIDIVMQILNLN